jgi:hypothetical protein
MKIVGVPCRRQAAILDADLAADLVLQQAQGDPTQHGQVGRRVVLTGRRVDLMTWLRVSQSKRIQRLAKCCLTEGAAWSSPGTSR